MPQRHTLLTPADTSLPCNTHNTFHTHIHSWHDPWRNTQPRLPAIIVCDTNPRHRAVSHVERDGVMYYGMQPGTMVAWVRSLDTHLTHAKHAAPTHIPLAATSHHSESHLGAAVLMPTANQLPPGQPGHGENSTKRQDWVVTHPGKQHDRAIAHTAPGRHTTQVWEHGKRSMWIHRQVHASIKWLKLSIHPNGHMQKYVCICIFIILNVFIIYII